MMANQEQPEILLASSSSIRAKMLKDAGLNITVVPVGLDEDTIKQAMIEEGASAAHIAETLAELKTIRAARNTNDFVIGADQILSCEGGIFSKPASFEEARDQLMSLRGKTHELLTTACIAKGGSIIWRHSDAAQLHMRVFSQEFLEGYLSQHKERVLMSVGGYFLESQGVQLFDWIKGDYFTILGLPLIPLLGFLREQGVMLT